MSWEDICQSKKDSQAELQRNKAAELLNEVRTLGRYPVEHQASEDPDKEKERILAHNLRKARAAALFQPAEEAELAQLAGMTQQLQEAGVKVGFFLQFGYPGETREDIELTLQLVRDCLPDDIGISVSYPLPGTRFYERVQAQLGVQQNWVDSADLAMMYEGPFPTSFYRQLHTVVHKEFRARRSWLKLRQIARQPARWRLAHLRELAAIGYRWGTLPLARWRLNRLATAAQPQAVTLPATQLLPHIPLAESAQPTPQPEVDGGE